MSLGKCICQRESVELQDSHLIPKAVYRLIEKSHGGKAPIIVKSVTLQKNEQVRAHVFCDSCEQRFSDYGEQWTLDHCNRFAEGFRLQKTVSTLRPQFDQQGTTAEMNPSIDRRLSNRLWRKTNRQRRRNIWRSPVAILKLSSAGKRWKGVRLPADLNSHQRLEFVMSHSWIHRGVPTTVLPWRSRRHCRRLQSRRSCWMRFGRSGRRSRQRPQPPSSARS